MARASKWKWVYLPAALLAAGGCVAGTLAVRSVVQTRPAPMRPGDPVTVAGEYETVWAGRSEASFRRIEHAVRANDPHGLAQLSNAGELVDVPTGTRGLVLAVRGNAAEVRITEGKLEGRALFLSLKNLRR